MYLCEECGKKFKEKEELERHSRVHSKKEVKKKSGLRIKADYKLVAVAIALFALGFLVFRTLTPTDDGGENSSTRPSESYLDEPFPFGRESIHWHATPSIYICGQKREIPAPAGDAHLGYDDLHTHSDRLIHVESVVTNRRQITLGRFFGGIGIKFSGQQIWDRKNSDLCDGKPASVKLLVNGNEDPEFENYVIADGDRIEIRFE